MRHSRDDTENYPRTRRRDDVFTFWEQGDAIAKAKDESFIAYQDTQCSPRTSHTPVDAAAAEPAVAEAQPDTASASAPHTVDTQRPPSAVVAAVELQ